MNVRRIHVDAGYHSTLQRHEVWRRQYGSYGVHVHVLVQAQNQSLANAVVFQHG